MNVPDVRVETQNASIRNDEGNASLVKSVKAQIASNLPRSEVRTASGADGCSASEPESSQTLF